MDVSLMGMSYENHLQNFVVSLLVRGQIDTGHGRSSHGLGNFWMDGWNHSTVILASDGWFIRKVS